jgi:hypothetical protein
VLSSCNFGVLATMSPLNLNSFLLRIIGDLLLNVYSQHFWWVRPGCSQRAHMDWRGIA